MTSRHIVREIALIACTVACVYGGIQLWQWNVQSGEGGRMPVGTPVPEMTMSMLDDDRTWASTRLQGRPAVLQYWATTCGVCRRELPALQRLHDEAEERFHVWTVTSDSPEVVRRFFEKEGLHLPVLLDGDGQFARWLDVEVIPTTVIVNGQGEVVHDFEGAPFMGLLRKRLIGLSSNHD